MPNHRSYEQRKADKAKYQLKVKDNCVTRIIHLGRCVERAEAMLDRSYDVPTSPPSWTPSPSDDECEPENRDDGRKAKSGKAAAKIPPKPPKLESKHKTNIKQSLNPKVSLRPDVSRTRNDKTKASPRKVEQPKTPEPSAATPRASLSRARTVSQHSGPITRSQSAASRATESHASSSSKRRRMRVKTSSNAASDAAPVAASVKTPAATSSDLQALTSQGLIWRCRFLKIILLFYVIVKISSVAIPNALGISLCEAS